MVTIPADSNAGDVYVVTDILDPVTLANNPTTYSTHPIVLLPG